MKSRVLFVDHTAALGGAELVLLDVAHAYRDTSTVCLLSDGPFRGRLEDRGVNVQVLRGGDALHSIRRETSTFSVRAGIEALRLAFRMVPLARRHDCLHANSQKAFAIACVTGALARRPVIWDLNDLLAADHFSPFHIKLDVMLANRCARRVVANSRASADALVHHGGNAGKVHVLHKGIDPAPFDAVTQQQVADVRKELGIADAPTIGVFGRLARWKGQHIAIDAMRQLPELQLLIVGDALFGEEEYAEELRQQVAQAGLERRVRFTGFRNDIPVLMRAVDIVAHTSIAPEPFGRVIVEGMLSQRAVIATRGGGVNEIIEPDVTGVLVQPGDPTALAAAAKRLLDDTGRRREMARAARQSALEQFSVTAMVAGMAQHIEGITRQ
jgi:glycosyltransferase involved in cell wall biosynthesis